MSIALLNHGVVHDNEKSEEISERFSHHTFNNFIYKFQFWETPGKERCIKYLSNYCLGSHLLIIIFDLNKVSSFEKAERILKSIEICGINNKILLGNKYKSAHSHKSSADFVDQANAEILAKTYNCDYFVCDSTDSSSVGLVYEKIMNNISTLNEFPLDLIKLSEKAIIPGKRVFTHPDFIKSMKEASLFNN